MNLELAQTSLWYYCKWQLQWNLVSTSCLWWLPYIISRPSKQNLFYLKVSDLVEENLQRDDEEWYEELSNNTKAYVKTEHVEIEAIKRDWEATSRSSTITLALFVYNYRHLKFLNKKCLSTNPPMQWLPSFAVVQVRGAGLPQPAAGRGQWGVGRDIRVPAD